MATDPFPADRVTFPGPFSHHDVVVDGWRVPFLQAQIAGEDRVLLVLDRRLALELDCVEAEHFVPFLADAIAVALGYGAHPRSDDRRPLERAPYPRPERVVDVVLCSEETG
jgi:hypothetical protein